MERFLSLYQGLPLALEFLEEGGYKFLRLPLTVPWFFFLAMMSSFILLMVVLLVMMWRRK